MALYQMRQRDPLMDPNTQAALERRARELIGIGLICLALIFVVMLGSYAPEDPGWLVSSDQPIRNWLGRIGAAISSTLVIITGRGAWAIPLILLVWGGRFVIHRGADRAVGRVVFALIAVAMTSVFAATFVPGDGWPHSFGLGGLFGDTVLGAMLGVAPVKATFGLVMMSLLTGAATLAMLLFVTGFDRDELAVLRRHAMTLSVIAYSRALDLAGQGSSRAFQAASAMGERQRQRRADGQAQRQAEAEARRLAPVNLSAPEPMAVAHRRNRVIRAEGEPMGGYEIAPPMRPAVAPAHARQVADWDDYGDDEVIAPPMPEPTPLPRKKEGLLGRLLRAPVEPELVIPELPQTQTMNDDAPNEDRIKARISDVIRSRVRQGMGTAAPQPHMSPLQAAIARREPTLRRGQAAQMRIEPPVSAGSAPVAAPVVAAAPGDAISAAVASAAARAAQAQEHARRMVDQVEAPVVSPAQPAVGAPRAASAAAAAVAAAIRAGAARAAAAQAGLASAAVSPEAAPSPSPSPLPRPGVVQDVAVAPQPAPPAVPRRIEPEPAATSWDDLADSMLSDDVDPALSQVDSFADDWELDDNFEPDYDPTPIQPAPARLVAQREGGGARVNAPLITPEVKRGVVQHPAKKPLMPSRQAAAEAQPRLRFEEMAQPEYELPPLSLLASPSTVSRHTLSDEALEENARMLESVLDDYGVKGEIVSVRPGPVVTMYELEPAPGLKASRVIGLADDIARSMSALSARVSTVPGRSVIGIELPNAQREKVVLREILAAREFGDGAQRLPLALGKDIGGDPIVANLAKMPHLLIAGTTGSGKSVAINTMILSLLYKLTPEECRLIMIDPKMLELSVYDGIPHLLSPVVTDPKKAVVALKWVVGEMEERYRKMSKMGVRNIDGYNGRVREAMANGEMFKRTIQTGFDEDTGEPVFETEEFAPVALPYIVVIVDEMADLMMVAGKEIEACIQRLAQMARASGIHLIMATQRPSVDVITGTIKANFPTRISFQVTSKIDSRTILGEQGAEQLLGQGDMLYMGNGARITRIHGPFVSDEEVEEIVTHLKSFGPPQYMSGVVEGPEDDVASDIDAVLGLTGGNTEGEDALYDQAVAIVARDRKCSTSYIQRKLGIGYNKAARLVEQMEEQGVVTPANHVGKREILIPEA